MSKLVKYYYDLLSQPSRALWIALKLGKTPFEDCPVALRKREQLTDEYKEINRFQKVPCIVDGDFHLSESVAIVRYLADKNLFSTALYPKELKARARVDEFLEWQPLTLRATCHLYFSKVWLLPINGLAPQPSAEQDAKMLKEMLRNLELVERIWLQKNDFLAGNQLTVADLFGICEIEQTKLCKFEVDAKQFPKIAKWQERVHNAANPYYDEANKFLNKKSQASAKI